MRIHPTLLGFALLLALVACTGDTLPVDPVNVTANLTTSGSARVDWGSVPNARKYIVERQAGNGSFEEIATPSAPPFEDTGLRINNTYTYRVRASNNAGSSGGLQSNTVTPGPISGTVSLGVGASSVPSSPLQPLQSQSLRSATFQPDWTRPFVPGQLLLVSHPNTLRTLSSALSLRGLALEPVNTTLSRVIVPVGQEQSLAATISSETGAIVQPNYIYRPLATPSDPDFQREQLSVMNQINAAQAWDIQATVTDGLIAVIDTGVQLDHPDLANRIVVGRDFCATIVKDACTSNNASITGDLPSGHGTHTFGIIAAITNNARGVAGITWNGKVLAIKTFGVPAGSTDANDETGDSVALASAINYAVSQKAKVINLSLGLPTSELNSFDPDRLVDTAIQNASNNDVLVVAAAGNKNGPLFYPASNPTVLSVGSVNAANGISFFSARGTGLDLVAPGEAIYSTVPGSAYGEQSGTSESSPQVAAIAGLMRSRNPNLTALQTRGILENTAKDLGTPARDDTYGFGLVQAGKALEKAALAGAGAARLVYVFAAPLPPGADPNNPASYQTNHPLTGHTTVVLADGSTSVPYTMFRTAGDAGLPTGNYLIGACINQNGNAEVCDGGDLVDSWYPVVFSGPKEPNINLTLTLK